MTVNELRNLLDYHSKHGAGENTVVVALVDPRGSIGGRPFAKVIGGEIGIDWEGGQFRLRTNKRLLPYPQGDRRADDGTDESSI